jgi:predicted  nucleic acid-binding Zn-ribbon protein
MTTKEQIQSLREQILVLKVQSQKTNTKKTIQKLQQELDGLIQRKTNGV